MSQVRPTAMMSKPVKTGPKPKKRLRRVSKKRGQELMRYAGERYDYLKEHPICEWMEPVPGPIALFVLCTRPSTNIHHSFGREGKLLYDKRGFKACCDLHGGPYPHDHADIAYTTGFSVLRHKVSSKNVLPS